MIARRLNERVAEDDDTNVNGRSADDSNDESCMMMSRTHQMMSQ